jgi:hypothetical protein
MAILVKVSDREISHQIDVQYSTLLCPSVSIRRLLLVNSFHVRSPDLDLGLVPVSFVVLLRYHGVSHHRASSGAWGRSLETVECLWRGPYV